MRKGFTLVEMLIVIGISAMLSAVALLYTNASKSQIALSVETAKVSQFVLRAKDLAIATYNTTAQTCAYGISLNLVNQTYSIFSYTPQNHPPEHKAAPPCPNNTIASTSPVNAGEISKYSDTTWNIKIANGVKMNDGGKGDNARIILFYPPAPTTYISRDGVNFLDPTKVANVTLKIYLSTANGSNSTTITINGAGQVSY